MANELSQIDMSSQELNNSQNSNKFELASDVQAAQVKALIEARFIVAKKMPRDLNKVRQDMLNDCKRPYFAEVAIYSKPVGNKSIEGASIRFAESAIRNMGNILIDTNAIYDDKQKRIIKVTTTDIEKNTSYAMDITIQKTVERKFAKPTDTVVSKRLNSKNENVFIIEATDDEIIIKQNALISKAVRTLGLRLIPGDLIDECLDMVKETQKNKDKLNPEQAKNKVFDAFNSIGITVDMLKEYLNGEITVLSPIQLQDLRGLYQSLKDGETTWREVMELVNPVKAANKEKNIFSDKVEDKKEEQINKKNIDEPSDLIKKQLTIREVIGDENMKGLEMYLIASKKLKPSEKISDMNEDLSDIIIKTIDLYKAKAIEYQAKIK